ncbi:hypothetical protein HOO54_11080 [Bacillus sp. WMMC1349]|nr:hypothetical protein [Bacillus sp. WMMC1349]
MSLIFQMLKRKQSVYDVTIFQTPQFGEDKGYELVYRTEVNGRTHEDVLKRTFSTFNVYDTVPNDYKARFLATGDIVLIDEGRKGKTYYKLLSTGWSKINRVLLQTS